MAVLVRFCLSYDLKMFCFYLYGIHIFTEKYFVKSLTKPTTNIFRSGERLETSVKSSEMLYNPAVVDVTVSGGKWSRLYAKHIF